MNEAMAKAIAAERAISGMTVKQLAEQSGIPERTLHRMLLAERDIKIDQLAMVADAFEVAPHYLMARAEEIRDRTGAQQTVLRFPARPGADDIDELITLNPAASDPAEGYDPDAEVEAQQDQP
jgi:transcriptional regulator with XRE-family HTH domain